MFIHVAYKDPPELSDFRRMSSTSEDLTEEKSLIVNPDCHVRVMLEYIRKQCKLAAFTQFDLCDENGNLKNLFKFPTYAYVHEQFEHKKTYYLIVITLDYEKNMLIIPQLNWDNRMYSELQYKVKRFLSGELQESITTAGKNTCHSVPCAVCKIRYVCTAKKGGDRRENYQLENLTNNLNSLE